MNNKYEKMLPTWYKDNSPKDLILSNDIDSLLSIKLLEMIKPNWKLKYFYDFDSGLFATGKRSGSENAVGVDIALDYKGLKTFDNHVTSDNGKNINPNAINLNNVCGISSSNYSRKYCCSTALLIYSLFNIPLPKSDTGKALLLAIDSTYYSYFNPIRKNRWDWVNVHKHWFDVLELNELFEIEQKYKEEDFNKFSFINEAKIQLIDEWGDGDYTMYFPLERKDRIEKELEISLDIPADNFRLLKEVKAKSMNLDGRHKSDVLKNQDVFSFAMTAKNHCNYSVLK